MAEDAAAMIRANLVWFALAYVGVSLAVGAVLVGLDYAGVKLPAGVNTGANIGGFMAVVALAGRRYAARANYQWTRAERGRLGAGYVLTAIGISAALAALFIAAMAVLDANFLPSLARESGGAIGLLALITLAVLAVLGFLFYGAARLMLGRIANARPETL